MQEDAQLAQGAEDLDAQHQDDQERGQLHLPRPHAIRAQPERHRRADGDAGVGDAAGEGVRPEHAHGAVEEGVALVLEQLRPRPALAEGLEGRQALDRIEELGAEGGVRLLAPPAVPAVEPMPGGGGDERDQRGEEERQRDGQIDDGDAGEDQDRREGGHDELGQVLAEVHLELLDPLDHRQDHVPGPGCREVGRAELGHVRMDRLAQARLDARGGLVRHQGPRVVERTPETDQEGHRGRHHHHSRKGRARQDATEEPAQEREPRNPGRHGQHPQQHRPGNPDAHPRGEGPEPAIDVHGSSG